MATDIEQTCNLYRVDDIVVDVGARQVFRGKQEIRLPKLSFDLLVALVTAAPNTLSIDELIEQVWGGTVVSSATVSKRVELLRHALGEDSQEPRFRNHGSYVSRVARQANELVRQRYLLQTDAGALVDTASESNVGKPRACSSGP